MKRKWTIETANRHITRVDNHELPMGLTYWSAKDYLKNHTFKEEKSHVELLSKSGS